MFKKIILSTVLVATAMGTQSVRAENNKWFFGTLAAGASLVGGLSYLSHYQQEQELKQEQEKHKQQQQKDQKQQPKIVDTVAKATAQQQENLKRKEQEQEQAKLRQQKQKAERALKAKAAAYGLILQTLPALPEHGAGMARVAGRILRSNIVKGTAFALVFNAGTVIACAAGPTACSYAHNKINSKLEQWKSVRANKKLDDQQLMTANSGRFYPFNIA